MRRLTATLFAGLLAAPGVFSEGALGPFRDSQADRVKALIRADVILRVEALDRASIQYSSIREHATQEWLIRDIFLFQQHLETYLNKKFRISANLSGRQLRDDRFVKYLADLIEESGIDLKIYDVNDLVKLSMGV